MREHRVDCLNTHGGGLHRKEDSKWNKDNEQKDFYCQRKKVLMRKFERKRNKSQLNIMKKH